MPQAGFKTAAMYLLFIPLIERLPVICYLTNILAYWHRSWINCLEPIGRSMSINWLYDNP